VFAEAILQTPTPKPCDVVELDGFFQRLPFFAKHLDWLRPTFWNAEVAGRARFIKERWEEKAGVVGAVVGVHLRLGDYVGIGRNLDMAYYREALQEVKQRRGVEELTCMIFSDDILLAANVSLELKACTKRIPVYPCQEFGLGTSCGSSERTVNDRVSFYMMSQLRNIVIADSTYSFWAAALSPNEPLVVAPRVVKPTYIARRRDYAYLSTKLFGWVHLDASIGDTTSQAVRDSLGLSQELDYAAQVRMSEWAA